MAPIIPPANTTTPAETTDHFSSTLDRSTIAMFILVILLSISLFIAVGAWLKASAINTTAEYEVLRARVQLANMESELRKAQRRLERRRGNRDRGTSRPATTTATTAAPPNVRFNASEFTSEVARLYDELLARGGARGEVEAAGAEPAMELEDRPAGGFPEVLAPVYAPGHRERLPLYSAGR